VCCHIVLPRSSLDCQQFQRVHSAAKHCSNLLQRAFYFCGNSQQEIFCANRGFGVENVKNDFSNNIAREQDVLQIDKLPQALLLLMFLLLVNPLVSLLLVLPLSILPYELTHPLPLPFVISTAVAALPAMMLLLFLLPCQCIASLPWSSNAWPPSQGTKATWVSTDEAAKLSHTGKHGSLAKCSKESCMSCGRLCYFLAFLVESLAKHDLIVLSGHR